MDTALPIHRGVESDDERFFFAYSATLRVSGDLPDLNAISSALGLQPTHTHKSGDPNYPYSHDMWSYTPAVDRSEPLHKHIDALWAALKPRKQYLLELKKYATVEVFLGYRSDCETAGIEVPHTSLEMFTELEIPFGLSIIVT
jgi:hypothetical protein